MQRWQHLASSNLTSEAVGAASSSSAEKAPSQPQTASGASGLTQTAGLFQLRPSVSSGQLTTGQGERKSFNYQSSDNQSSYVSSNVFAVSDWETPIYQLTLPDI